MCPFMHICTCFFQDHVSKWACWDVYVQLLRGRCQLNACPHFPCAFSSSTLSVLSVVDILMVCRGFLGGSDSEGAACNTGDMSLIPGSGRSPREGNATHFSILPRKFHGQRSLVGYSSWCHNELDTIELTLFTFSGISWIIGLNMKSRIISCPENRRRIYTCAQAEIFKQDT